MFVQRNWMKATWYSGQHEMAWPAGSKALPWRSIVMAPSKIILCFKEAGEGGISFLCGPEPDEADPCPLREGRKLVLDISALFPAESWDSL